MSRASGAAANLALRRRLSTRSRPQCHDVRYRLTPPSPAPEPRFRRCLAVASVPAKAPAASSIRPKSPNLPRRQRQTRSRHRRSRRPHPPTHLQPKSPPRQIPIDGNRPPGGPRVPSWEAFGRRPSERTRIVTTGRHPKPFTASVMRRLSLNRSEPAKKSGQDIPKNRCRTTPSPSSRESDFCARLSGRLWRSPMADDNLQHRIRSESEPARDIRWVRRPPSPWRARAQPICRR